MHSVYLGPGKRLLDFLLGEPKKKKCRKDVKLNSALKMELDRRTKMIKGDIPDEFPRKMRETSKYHQFKAVEHKFMLQNAGPIVFKKIMHGDLYKHFMLSIMGCRLLSGRNVEAHVAQVRGLFLEFVQKAPSLYGQEFVSILVHCLIHICDDVERYGLNLTELSAFEFESYLGFISSLLRSPTHLVVQYCNRMEEAELYRIDPEENATQEMTILMRTKTAVQKIKYKGMILGDSHPNSTVLLANKTVAEIQRFEYEGADLFVVVKKFKKTAFLDSKWDPDIFNNWEVTCSSQDEWTVPLNTIVLKFVRFQMNYSKDESKRLFVVPLLL
ncbi:hypothetical protein QAD02_009659 [Eretmocerus hayati]|uniref:Uncharacterized protein n=1 Tax=Eretmocerus hayati TaxID=131215 RepID=A0ACC2NAQ8_9HYME|nr:hypothetical protein QAD02_009659 [Eretmocerus hayati]